MANTIDILGDETAAGMIIDRSVTSFIDDLVTSIGSYAFHNCTSLTSVDFPLVTSIGSLAFYNCTSLTSVDFPLVTSIGSYAFYNCTSLTSVDFPLVTSIGSYAFQDCTSLTSLILRSSTVAGLSSAKAFFNCPAVIYVPDDLVDSYKAASNWSTHADRIKGISELPEE